MPEVRARFPRHVRTTSQGLRDRSEPRARPHWARMRKWSAVAPELSRCRIAYSRRTRKSSKEIREAVSDQAEAFVAGVSGRPRGAPKEKGTAIMKLTTTTQVSVDGVMQGNGPSEEERMAGFERDGWAMGHFDNESRTFVEQVYQRADAFLFGRWTYDIFADYWGVMDPGSGPIADALNTKPKYVASNTLTDPRWADTTVLSGDLTVAIGELKAKQGGELQVHGSGALVRWLLENDLVDEMNLLIVPVVVGQGTRLFPATGPDIALDLVESRAFPKGITIQVYRPAGRPQYATG